ncbi:MAG: hypothetical protein GH152_00565 [Dehalococcoidia bacterium]|nr:hypothetical protein [Dehalococcoidia bacterium]
MSEHLNYRQELGFLSTPDEDGVDFPCSPPFVRHYADLGLTQNYPPEFYWPNISALEEKIQELENEIDELKGRRILYKYIQPIKPTPKWKGFAVEK